MLGGLLGGWVISRHGLKRWLWIMVFAMHLPDAIFIWLSRAMPESLLLINIAVAVEQFGYGFGFTAYSLVMIMVSEGEYKTVHYAIATGIMALGMMLPAMISRLAPGTDGVFPLFPLDTALDHPRFHRDGDDPDRSGVRERGIGRQPYLLDTQDASRYPQTTQKQVKYGIFNDEI